MNFLLSGARRSEVKKGREVLEQSLVKSPVKRKQSVAACPILLQSFTRWLSAPENFRLQVGFADQFGGQANVGPIETAVVAHAKANILFPTFNRLGQEPLP